MPSSATPELSTLSLHDALPISPPTPASRGRLARRLAGLKRRVVTFDGSIRHLEHLYPRAMYRRTFRRAAAVSRGLLPHIERGDFRSEEHTSELQSLRHLVCRLLPPPSSPLFPYTTLFRSRHQPPHRAAAWRVDWPA